MRYMDFLIRIRIIKYLKQIANYCVLLFSLNSCGIFGLHLSDHNPKKQGKYPNFGRETVLLGELTSIRENFDVTFYSLDISINPAEKSLGGWVEVQAVALRNIDSIQLDLDMPLTIEDIRWQGREGKKLSYARNYRALYIQLPKTVVRGEGFTIHVKYSGKPQIAKKPPWDGGLVWKKDADKNVWVGVACESEGASIWFPCKDHTSDEPDSAQMRFTIPSNGLTVVSNGVFEGEEIFGDKKSFKWKVSYPINTYNITFYIGSFEKIEDIYTGIDSNRLEITHYVLKQNADKARVHFKQVKEHIRIYEELYGEYPWYKDGFKLVESPYAGMEHQTAIAYGNGYKNDLLQQQEDYIMLHETGHEWFGNAITASDLSDVWLQEGITTYGEFLYLERKYGEKEAFRHLAFYRMTIKNKLPLIGPKGRRYFDYHDGDVYVKGAWMLHTLRNQIKDDSVFLLALRTFYKENKLRVTDSKNFMETVNKVTGEDYQWFFDQYLYRNEVPFLEFVSIGDGNLYYRWTHAHDDFKTLRVTVSFEGVERTHDIYPNSIVQKLELSNEERNAPTFYFNERKMLFGLKQNRKLYSIYHVQHREE